MNIINVMRPVALQLKANRQRCSFLDPNSLNFVPSVTVINYHNEISQDNNVSLCCRLFFLQQGKCTVAVQHGVIK